MSTSSATTLKNGQSDDTDGSLSMTTTVQIVPPPPRRSPSTMLEARSPRCPSRCCASRPVAL